MGGGDTARRDARIVKRYCITDSADVAARAAAAGAAMIQVRAKWLAARDLTALVRRVIEAARGVPVLVNTRVDVALACGAQGVHLPAHSPAPEFVRAIAPRGFLVGISCHTLEELARAAEEGADFAVYGPVFATRSHPASRPLGLDALAAATRQVRLPIYALGGITEENAPLCIAAGAAGVAGISLFE
jgi:thiamine-phosphate pyrophosphorylase